MPIHHRRLRNIKRDMSQEIEKRKQFNVADVNTGFMAKSKQRKERNE